MIIFFISTFKMINFRKTFAEIALFQQLILTNAKIFMQNVTI